MVRAKQVRKPVGGAADEPQSPCSVAQRIQACSQIMAWFKEGLHASPC
jgi:hypothetical protein